MIRLHKFALIPHISNILGILLNDLHFFLQHCFIFLAISFGTFLHILCLMCVSCAREAGPQTGNAFLIQLL
jgi:hypothetical protein